MASWDSSAGGTGATTMAWRWRDNVPTVAKDLVDLRRDAIVDGIADDGVAVVDVDGAEGIVAVVATTLRWLRIDVEVAAIGVVSVMVERGVTDLNGLTVLAIVLVFCPIIWRDAIVDGRVIDVVVMDVVVEGVGATEAGLPGRTLEIVGRGVVEVVVVAGVGVGPKSRERDADCAPRLDMVGRVVGAAVDALLNGGANVGREGAAKRLPLSTPGLATDL